jgi:hypothetical protein
MRNVDPAAQGGPRARPLFLLLAVGFTAAFPGTLAAQEGNVTVNPDILSALEYRMIGPYRGGRSTAVTGHPTDPDIFYTGTTGGGVWTTDDAGKTWSNITDGYFEVGPVGALDVCPDHSVTHVPSPYRIRPPSPMSSISPQTGALGFARLGSAACIFLSAGQPSLDHGGVP